MRSLYNGKGSVRWMRARSVRAMRILFYLPIVTPLWFVEVIAPMIRTLHPHAELHVLVPPLWRNTGVGQAELAACSDLSDIHWHIVGGDDHPSLRTAPADPDGLVGFVRSIAPDVTLCRSAETATPARFPGRVRYIMEAGAPPFARGNWIILQDEVFDHGAMPAFSPAEEQALEAAFAPHWRQAGEAFSAQGRYALSRREALAVLGLPADRPLIVVPLEYMHEENFFSMHNSHPDNIAFVSSLVKRVPADFVLALTDHPLNRQHGRTARLRGHVEAFGERVFLVENGPADAGLTNLLIKHSDGVIFQNSRTFAAAAFFGKPLMRLSDCPSAPWLNVYTDLPAFLEAVRTGAPGLPDAKAARRWFGWHLADEAIDAQAASAEDLLARIERPVDPARWLAGLLRYHDILRAKEIEHA